MPFSSMMGDPVEAAKRRAFLEQQRKMKDFGALKNTKIDADAYAMNLLGPSNSTPSVKSPQSKSNIEANVLPVSSSQNNEASSQLSGSVTHFAPVQPVVQKELPKKSLEEVMMSMCDIKGSNNQKRSDSPINKSREKGRPQSLPAWLTEEEIPNLPSIYGQLLAQVCAGTPDNQPNIQKLFTVLSSIGIDYSRTSSILLLTRQTPNGAMTQREFVEAIALAILSKQGNRFSGVNYLYGLSSPPLLDLPRPQIQPSVSMNPPTLSSNISASSSIGNSSGAHVLYPTVSQSVAIETKKSPEPAPASAMSFGSDDFDDFQSFQSVKNESTVIKTDPPVSSSTSNDKYAALRNIELPGDVESKCPDVKTDSDKSFESKTDNWLVEDEKPHIAAPPTSHENSTSSFGANLNKVPAPVTLDFVSEEPPAVPTTDLKAPIVESVPANLMEKEFTHNTTLDKSDAYPNTTFNEIVIPPVPKSPDHKPKEPEVENKTEVEEEDWAEWSATPYTKTEVDKSVSVTIEKHETSGNEHPQEDIWASPVSKTFSDNWLENDTKVPSEKDALPKDSSSNLPANDGIGIANVTVTAFDEPPTPPPVIPEPESLPQPMDFFNETTTPAAVINECQNPSSDSDMFSSFEMPPPSIKSSELPKSREKSPNLRGRTDTFGTMDSGSVSSLDLTNLPSSKSSVHATPNIGTGARVESVKDDTDDFSEFYQAGVTANNTAPTENNQSLNGLADFDFTDTSKPPNSDEANFVTAESKNKSDSVGDSSANIIIRSIEAACSLLKQSSSAFKEVSDGDDTILDALCTKRGRAFVAGIFCLILHSFF